MPYNLLKGKKELFLALLMKNQSPGKQHYAVMRKEQSYYLPMHL